MPSSQAFMPSSKLSFKVKVSFKQKLVKVGLQSHACLMCWCSCSTNPTEAPDDVGEEARR